MRSSWKVATIAGIPIRIHAPFFVFLAWLAWLSAARGGGAGQVAASVGFILAAFACVVLHEFGHAFMGRRFGVITRDITLLPIGGVARLDRMPRRPQEEVAIAPARPAVTVATAPPLPPLMPVS